LKKGLEAVSKPLVEATLKVRLKRRVAAMQQKGKDDILAFRKRRFETKQGFKMPP